VNDRDKSTTIGKEKESAVCCMDRFECHGKLCITPHEGTVDVKITHQQSHKKYVNIELPDKWRTFIKENHRMGPAKVCTWHEVPRIQ